MVRASRWMIAVAVARSTPTCLAILATGSSRPAASDRKSTRLNSSHGYISYAVFCLKKKKKKNTIMLWWQKLLILGSACTALWNKIQWSYVQTYVSMSMEMLLEQHCVFDVAIYTSL